MRVPTLALAWATTNTRSGRHRNWRRHLPQGSWTDHEGGWALTYYGGVTANCRQTWRAGPTKRGFCAVPPPHPRSRCRVAPLQLPERDQALPDVVGSGVDIGYLDKKVARSGQLTGAFVKVGQGVPLSQVLRSGFGALERILPATRPHP